MHKPVAYSFGAPQAEGERILTASGVSTTEVRPGFFLQNLLMFASQRLPACSRYPSAPARWR
jgi:uncharacterized protein YbjT (DUF2867 family)